MSKIRRKEVLIRKASGEKEPFDIFKLKRSLRNAGADGGTIEEIAADIESWVSDGATTKNIYVRAYKLLRQKEKAGALRYRLKNALFSMGPSGYPFEHFIGELFKRMGYDVQVGQIVQGVIITHEIDVIATKENRQNIMECKYTHDQGNRLSVQVPLYVNSRVSDIAEKRRQDPLYKNISFTPWVVTNARFSSDSEAYSKGKNIQLLGWDYPQGRGLKDLIERENIFPVTILKSLNKKEKQQLMEDRIVTCAQLLGNADIITRLGMDTRKLRALLIELEEITGKI